MSKTDIFIEILSTIPTWVYVLVFLCIVIICVIARLLEYSFKAVTAIGLVTSVIAVVVLSIIYVPTDIGIEEQPVQVATIIQMPDGTTYELPTVPTETPKTVGDIGKDALSKIDNLYKQVEDIDFEQAQGEITDAEKLQEFLSKLTGTDITIDESSALYEILMEAGVLGN